MSNASIRADVRARDRAERLQAWGAALLTALLHLLLLLLAMLSPPVTVTAPQGSSGGSSSLQVTWIDETLSSPTPASPASAVAPSPPSPAATRIQPPPVMQGDEPVLPPVPTDVPDEPVQRQAQVPAAPPSPPTQRPARLRGQPPGMRLQDLPSANAGPARSTAVNRGRGNNPSASGSSLGVDGYQVYYDHVHQTRLRAWRDQGMTEVFLPLPGTRRFMVCPLEIMLRRGSGACRMVEPDAAELATIGDARQVILMERVYRLGKELWSGPGPYR